MSSTFLVLFLTVGHYNQLPTKAAVYFNGAKKKVAQSTLVCSFKGSSSTLAHEVESQWPYSVCVELYHFEDRSGLIP